jgi:hypothetical protein
MCLSVRNVFRKWEGVALRIYFDRDLTGKKQPILAVGIWVGGRRA